MSTVLVVDDDAAIRTVVAQALRRAGHDVTVADSLAQLERALAVSLPDVLITDVILPTASITSAASPRAFRCCRSSSSRHRTR